MLTCMARSKQPEPDDLHQSNHNDAVSPPPTSTKQSTKKITSQIKDMALKASGAYRSCNPCTGSATMMTPQQHLQKSNDPESERFRWSYRRTGSKNSSSGRVWGKEMEARLKGISMGSSEAASAGTLSASASGRRTDPIVLVEEIEPKEWVAQVEPGVLITFVSMPRGGNDLKRIRFSREMFNKFQAQQWWQENYDKIMELYNVQKLNRQAFPHPTPPRSDDEIWKMECFNGDSPITPGLSRERVLQRSSALTSTPKVSSISGTKTGSSETSSSREEPSISNVSDTENEWVEQDEPGVYITIRALPNGSKELRRVRFSREKFGEIHARLWWEENRARIHKNYL